MDTSKELLDRQIQVELEAIASEENPEIRKPHVETLKELYTMKLDAYQAENAVNTRTAETIVDAVTGVGGLVLGAVFTIAGFNFEKTGSLLSPTFRNWWSKFPTFRR